MCTINGSAVQDRLSKNYLMQNFIAQNILDKKYLQFTALALCRESERI